MREASGRKRRGRSEDDCDHRRRGLGAGGGRGGRRGRAGCGRRRGRGAGRRVRGVRPGGTLHSGDGQRAVQLLERPARRGRLPQRRFCQTCAFRVRMPGASCACRPRQRRAPRTRTACWGSSPTTGLCGARKGRGACTRSRTRPHPCSIACGRLVLRRGWKSAWNARSWPWSRRAPRAPRSRCASPTGASSGPVWLSWPWEAPSRASFCPRAFPSASRSRRWGRWPPIRACRVASTTSACAGRWSCGAPTAAGWTAGR